MVINNSIIINNAIKICGMKFCDTNMIPTPITKLCIGKKSMTSLLQSTVSPPRI